MKIDEKNITQIYSMKAHAVEYLKKSHNHVYRYPKLFEKI